MAAMRATMHNGRGSGAKAYGTKHNDRNFDTTQADNIDAERSHLNEYWHYYEGEKMTFEEAELRYYQEHFSEQLRRINERYQKNGHPENCREMADWKQSKRNAPEECIFQIGNLESHADHQVLMACWKDYLARMNAWSRDHGSPFEFVSWAMHADEAVPHIQARRVWKYQEPDGLLKVGQEKALKAAGVELPQPGKTENRHNNRKMTFDAMARQVWLDVLKDHRLEIEQLPVPDGKHNRSKEQMIRDKYQDMIDGAKEAAQAALEARQETAAQVSRAEAAQETARRSQAAIEVLQAQETVLQEKQAAAAQAAQEVTSKASMKGRRTLTGQIKLSQEEYDTLVQSAASQAAVVASERANADFYRRDSEKARAETQEAREALQEANRKPLSQAMQEVELKQAKDQIAALRAENAGLRREVQALRQGIDKLVSYVRAKAPSWLKEFGRLIEQIIPKKSLVQERQSMRSFERGR